MYLRTHDTMYINARKCIECLRKHAQLGENGCFWWEEWVSLLRRREMWIVILIFFPFVGFDATLTNYHKIWGLKQHRFITLEFCKSEVWQKSHGAKSKVTGGHMSLQAPEENPFPCLFLLPKITCIPWLLVPFLTPAHLSTLLFIFTSSLTRAKKCSPI